LEKPEDCEDYSPRDREERFQRFLKKEPDCPLVRERGHHIDSDFKRKHVGRHYVYLCRGCGKEKDKRKVGGYKTFQGILDEVVLALRTRRSPRLPEDLEEEEYEARMEEADREFEQDPFDDLGYTDPGMVWDRLTERPRVDIGGYDDLGVLDEGRGAVPAGIEWGGKKAAKRRFRKIIEEEKKTKRLAKAIEPWREKIRGLLSRVNSCRSKVDSRILDYSKESIETCVLYFVMECVGREQPPNENQLITLTAAATYHYLRTELNQSDVVGTPESMFPEVSRRTLVDWYSCVKAYDSTPIRLDFAQKSAA
jgi:hypothetical protein